MPSARSPRKGLLPVRTERAGGLSDTGFGGRSPRRRISTIIGIDCATKRPKRGIALAQRDRERWRLAALHAGRGAPSTFEAVTSWIDDADCPVLLALDAPLGWPAALSAELSSHRAGSPMEASSNQLFARYTDRFVHQTLGKKPFDVGADRIARTAHWAVGFLGAIRASLGLLIPLAWDTHFDGTSVIEVYPAATALAHRPEIKKYKREARRSELLAEHLDIGPHEDLIASNDDALDAAMCVVAGIDFLRGGCHAPPNMDVARKEGWIWVRAPSNTTHRSSIQIAPFGHS